MADGLVQQKVYGTSLSLGEDTAEEQLESHIAKAAAQLEEAALPPQRLPFGVYGLTRLVRYADLAIAIAISWYCLSLSGATILSATVFQILPFVMLPVLLSWGLRTAGAYEFGFGKGVVNHMVRTTNGAGLALLVLAVSVAFIYTAEAARWVILAALVTWLATLIFHAHAIALIRGLVRRGRLSENVVIVGATPNAQRLVERNHKTKELNIVGVFDDRLARAPISIADAPLLGQLDDLLNWERLPEIDRIIVTITSDARERVRTLIDRLRVLPQRVVLLLDLDGFDPETESLAQIARSPAAYVSGTPQNNRRAIVKQLSDMVFASLMLVAFSPLFAILAAAIKVESKGPVFFRQRRHGFNNQIIRVWKFRSMRDDPQAAEMMGQQTQPDDPRVTRIGRFIRRTSLDELPQLLNVLKGEMSIVGPRPHAVGMTAEEMSVQGIVGDYAHRHRVKPGITGWAQINGSRGPVHTKDLVRERVRLDMEYVNRSSFWFDLYIMLMTAPCLLGDKSRHR